MGGSDYSSVMQPVAVTGKEEENDLKAFSFQALHLQLTRPANGFGFFAGAALGGLFIGSAELHFTKNALSLHFFLQCLEGLIDIIITNNDLHVYISFIMSGFLVITNSKRRISYAGPFGPLCLQATGRL